MYVCTRTSLSLVVLGHERKNRMLGWNEFLAKVFFQLLPHIYRLQTYTHVSSFTHVVVTRNFTIFDTKCRSRNGKYSQVSCVPCISFWNGQHKSEKRSNIREIMSRYGDNVVVVALSARHGDKSKIYRWPPNAYLFSTEHYRIRVCDTANANAVFKLYSSS